jgi:hypothetical protein
MASIIDAVETPVIATDSYCCAYRVLEDVKDFCAGEENAFGTFILACGKAERPYANRVQIEQNLLFYYSTSLTSTPIGALKLIEPIRRSDF